MHRNCHCDYYLSTSVHQSWCHMQLYCSWAPNVWRDCVPIAYAWQTSPEIYLILQKHRSFKDKILQLVQSLWIQSVSEYFTYIQNGFHYDSQTVQLLRVKSQVQTCLQLQSFIKSRVRVQSSINMFTVTKFDKESCQSAVKNRHVTVTETNKVL